MDQKQFHKTSNNCEINLNGQYRSRFSFLTMDFLLLFLLVVFGFIVYSSSIKGPFVFDDMVNIRDNSKFRLTELTLNEMVRAGFESPCSHRPVANISFALNYYFNRYDVAGYHLVNILMHMATGIILFYFFKITLGLLNAYNFEFQIKKKASPDKQNCSIHNSTNSSISTSQHSLGPASTEILFISFFAAFIWLVHPLQTQTVSYIVQRMNCMAAMFYILSLLLYVKARLANSKWKKLALFLGCILSGILSLGSKEIAATLPFFIFLYEWYFFQDVSLKWLKRNSIYLFGFLFVVILIVFFYLDGHPIEKILSAYNHRDFTLWQRMLTEFRVVVYYISLLIFPHPMRLNLLHDFTISHSFIDPTTTLLSFIVIAGMMVTAIWLAKRERLLSFCILWFLGNLIIESSVIGLEIIFEHRTYLPSIFFILIIIVSVRRLINSKWLGAVLLCTVAIIFSIWTYQRNIVWSDDISLWEDVVKKSPNIARSQNNLGDTLMKRGHIDEAMDHFLRALQIDPDYTEAQNNLGVVLARNGNLDDAIEHYRTALNIKPGYSDAYYNLGNALARKGDAKAAIYNYRKALEFNPEFFKSYYNIARILSNQGKTGEAINNYQKALNINSETPQTLYHLSWIYATSENRSSRNGVKAVKLAEKLCMLTGYQQPLALDALAAAYAETGNFDRAVETAQKAFELALQLGPEEHIIGLKKRLKLYQARQPYRQSLK
jgi:protein O-mannosyl-transferase